VRAGLNNIRKRATILDGRAVIDSQPEKGTCIFLSIPY
jgi:signal transduction histidine kinase